MPLQKEQCGFEFATFGLEIAIKNLDTELQLFE